MNGSEASPRIANVVDWLHWRADASPSQLALLAPLGFRSAPATRRYESRTFGQLRERVERRVIGLQRLEIGVGTRVALMVPPSIELVELVYALFQVGAVPVLIDPGMGLKNIGRCLAEAEPTVFIGIPKAHIARSLAGWGRGSVTKLVTVNGPRGWWGGTRMDDLWGPFGATPVPRFEARDDDPAAILFTSGSTGVPKGAVYTHGIFNEQIRQLQACFGIEPGDIDLCTFPLFALFAPALGMTAIIPRMDATRPANVDPREILGPIARFGVTNLFGSPALLNRVGRALAQTVSHNGVIAAPTLRRVLSAGAPVAPAILERFTRLLSPGVPIYTPYGATEALPVAIISSREVLEETQHATATGAGTCVGRPVAGLDVRIIRISDEPIAAWAESLVLPTGAIGEIAVFGKQVTQQYYRRPDLTAIAKIPDAERGRVWHRMGDVGYCDTQGRLWFCGRKSQRVITAERTWFTDPVEGIFNAVPGVFRTALVGARVRGAIQPVVCVQLEKNAKTQAGVVAALQERGAGFELTRQLTTFLVHPQFPVDIRHNSKIFRERLAEWATQRLARSPSRSA